MQKPPSTWVSAINEHVGCVEILGIWTEEAREHESRPRRQVTLQKCMEVAVAEWLHAGGKGRRHVPTTNVARP